MTQTAARPAAAYALGERTPQEVVRPDSAEAAAETLRQANERRAAVVPWGAGTKQRFGNLPRAYDVALDLSALDQVVEYEPADLVVTAQAGTPLAALQRRLNEAGQFLALDPPFGEQATLGGTLATNVSGPSRLLYGTARDLVLGMRVATPQGHVVKSGGRVVKNVVGYDLNKMHIGGLGTLGVMVEVTLKVHPLPRAEASVLASFPSLEAAHAAAGRLFRSVLYPRAVELLSGDVHGVGGEGWRVLFWGAGSPATVERQVRDAEAWCREAGAQTERLDGDAHRAAWRAIQEFGRSLPEDGSLVKLTCLPTEVAALVAEVERAAGGAGARVRAVLAHAGNGVIYIALGGASADFMRSLPALAGQRGGSAVVEDAPLAIKRQIDVWGPTRNDFPLMQALKAQFDPHSTLNPGRFVGAI